MKILGKKLADKGYYINLDSSVDRKQNVEKQVEDFKISDLERLSALTDELIQSSATKSHRRALEFCLENNYESVLILEDDFQIQEKAVLGDSGLYKNLDEYLDEIIVEMETLEWDVILLGFNGKKTCVPISKNFSIAFKSTGAWAYIIKKDACKYILDTFNYKRDYLAIDDILPLLNYRGLRTLTTNVPIISHAVGFVSTLNPKGPVDYTAWITGNYYNSIWKYIKTLTSFDDAMLEIYNNSKPQRENILVIKNFPLNMDEIESKINSEEELRNFLIFLDVENINQDIINAMNYHLSVECKFLISWSTVLPHVKKFYNNIKYIDFNN